MSLFKQPEKKKICRHCGNQLTNKLPFCSTCGGFNGSIHNGSSKKKMKLGFINDLVGIGFILVILYLILSFSNSDKYFDIDEKGDHSLQQIISKSDSVVTKQTFYYEVVRGDTVHGVIYLFPERIWSCELNGN
jgi:hypothetical protein